MSLNWTNRASIRFRLLALLLPAMALVMLSNFWFARSDALISGNAAYDRSLVGAIKSIDLNISTASGGLSVELPYRLFEFFQLTAAGNVYYRVATADNLVEIGHPDLPQPTQVLKPGEPIFYDAQYFGESVRIGAFMRPLDPLLPDGEQLIIQVAESTLPREKFTNDLLRRSAWRDLWLWSLTGLVVILGLILALRPLTKLATQIRHRQPDDLQPLHTNGLPKDLLPLVEAVNQQLNRTESLMLARRAFIDDASHQLRTPLTVLKTQMDYTLRECDPERQKAGLLAISEEINLAIRATNQLLSLGQSDANSLQMGSFNIDEMVRSVAMALMPLARSKGIDLGVDFTDQNVLAKGDRDLLEQALLNIVHNALEHAKPQGKVTLKAEISDKMQRITVVDEGLGIPLEVLAHMGQRFVKGKHSRGSGLGLAIATSVMARHRGQIRSSAKETPQQHKLTLEWSNS